MVANHYSEHFTGAVLKKMVSIMSLSVTCCRVLVGASVWADPSSHLKLTLAPGKVNVMESPC